MGDAVKSITGRVGTWSFDETRELGPAGGFGRVYEGQGEDGTPVAVKVVEKSRFASSEMATKALRREIDIAETLFPSGSQTDPHSYLIRTLDHHEDDENLYVVMEKAETSLAGRLREGKLLEAEARVVLSDVSHALDELHRSGVVHRDLKPSNVLKHNGRWKLADFGISRDMALETGSATFRGWGTWEYMAPELWNGASASPKSDLYALGCLAYETIVGGLPFTGNADEIAEGHRQGSVGELPAAVDSVLASIVMRLLSKEPSGRPRDAQSVHQRLARVLDKKSPLVAALLDAERVHAEEKTEEDAARQEAAEAARQLREAENQGHDDLLEIVQDSFDLMEGAVSGARIEPDPRGITVACDDAALRIETWKPTASNRASGDTSVLQGIVSGRNRRLGRDSLVPSLVPLGNVVYENHGGQLTWVLYRFHAQGGLAYYELGPMDRPHGLLKIDFEEHRRHMLGDAAHIFTVERVPLTPERVLELLLEAMNLPKTK